MFVQKEPFNLLVKILTEIQLEFKQARPIVLNFPKANVLGRHSLRLEKMDTEKLCIFRLNLKLF